MLAGASLQTMAIAAQLTWHASFLIRIHGMSLTEVGLTLGLVSGVSGGIATFGGGVLADRLRDRDMRWYLWLPAIGALASLPFSTVAYLTPSKAMAITMIVCATLGNHVFAALGHAVGQSLVKPRMRATMSAIGLLAMNLVGFGLGPQIAGAISDLLRPRYGESSIRFALLAISFLLVASAFHYFRAARSYRSDLEIKDR